MREGGEQRDTAKKKPRRRGQKIKKTGGYRKGLNLWNKHGTKENATVLSYRMAEREDSRKTGGGGKEENRLTENIETKSDTKLRKAFKSTFKTANVGIIAWCVLLLNAVLCLALWKMTGARWISFVGAGSFLSAIGGIFTAFAAQTSNQFVRLDAKFKGKGKDFFSEEEKECSLSKTAAECYGFVKRVFNQDGKKTKHYYERHKVKYASNRRTANNARAYHRAPRPAFARPSHDGGGGDDDSGDSDQGDPPGPLCHTAITLTPYQTSHRKSNNPSFRRRPARAFGCWRMPRGKRSHRRWFI
jgi:hypothetical protein